MNIPRQMIEAGARAMYDAEPNYEDDPVCPWEKLGPGTHKRYADQAEAAIRAAIGCAQVFWEHQSTEHSNAVHVISPGCGVVEETVVRKGDTILIVRAEKGGGNG